MRISPVSSLAVLAAGFALACSPSNTSTSGSDPGTGDGNENPGGSDTEDAGDAGATSPPSTGTLDPAFGKAGIATVPNAESIHDLGVDSQGRVIVLYEYGVDRMVPSPETPADTLRWREPHYALARLTAAGTLDASFGSAGTVELTTMSRLLCHIGNCQPVSSTMTATWTLTVTPKDEPLLAARYGPTAGPKTSFGTDASYYSASILPVQSTVMRFTSSGVRDSGFGDNGEVQCRAGQSSYSWKAPANEGWEAGFCQGGVRPVVLSDGRILIAYANDIRILHPDGKIDTSFVPLNALPLPGAKSPSGAGNPRATLCQGHLGPDSWQWVPARILYFSEQPGGLFVAMNCELSYGALNDSVIRVYGAVFNLKGAPLGSTGIRALSSNQFSNAIDGTFYVVRNTINKQGATDSFQDLFRHAPSGESTVATGAHGGGFTYATIRLAADGKLLRFDNNALLRLTLTGNTATADSTFGSAGVATLPQGFTDDDRGIMALHQNGAVVVAASDARGPHVLRYLP